VHHVDDSWVVSEPAEEIPQLAGHEEPYPRIMMKLGPPIRPDGDGPIRSGRIRDRRMWVDIDLLFTCDSLIEAEARTRERREREARQQEENA
jgi:hypothetical protein